jgi:hypothetical protein
MWTKVIAARDVSVRKLVDSLPRWTVGYEHSRAFANADPEQPQLQNGTARSGIMNGLCVWAEWGADMAMCCCGLIVVPCRLAFVLSSLLRYAVLFILRPGRSVCSTALDRDSENA